MWSLAFSKSLVKSLFKSFAYFKWAFYFLIINM